MRQHHVGPTPRLHEDAGALVISLFADDRTHQRQMLHLRGGLRHALGELDAFYTAADRFGRPADALLARAAIDPTLRAEVLEIADFCRLARLLGGEDG